MPKGRPPAYDWPAIEAQLCQWVATHGPDIKGFAATVNVPYRSIVKRWGDHVRDSAAGRQAMGQYQRLTKRSVFADQVDPIKDIHDVLTLPPAPFPVTVPSLVKARAGRFLTAVIYGDSHFPHQDDTVLSIVLSIIRDAKPDVVLHMGDLVDCYDISRFDKDPMRVHTLQDEINDARDHFWHVREVAKDAGVWWLEGNHEDRLRRTIWNLSGAAAALTKLVKFQEAMTWPTLMDTEALGVTFVPSQGQARVPILPKAVTKHGNVVRKWSSYTARAEQEKYAKSGFSGHTHRLGSFWHSDYNGAHFWHETGCTCRLRPDYTEDPDWQNGCLVAVFDRETGAPSVEQVYIHNGLAIWRGTQYEEAAA